MALLCLWSATMLAKLLLASTESPDSFIFRIQAWPLLAGHLVTDRLADTARAEENTVTDRNIQKDEGNQDDRQ